MEKINALLLITPKKELAYLDETMSVRQALEKMRAHSYSEIPVITKETGEYLGTISEGDLLWYIVDQKEDNYCNLQKLNVTNLIRKDFRKALTSEASAEEIINVITRQNFVPIVDDRNILMGIVTRAKVISELSNSH